MLPHFKRNYGSTGSSSLQIASSRVALGSCLMTWIFYFVAKIRGGGTSVIWATEGGLNGGRFAAGYIHSIGHRLDGGVLPWSF